MGSKPHRPHGLNCKLVRSFVYLTSILELQIWCPIVTPDVLSINDIAWLLWFWPPQDVAKNSFLTTSSEPIKAWKNRQTKLMGFDLRVIFNKTAYAGPSNEKFLCHFQEGGCPEKVQKSPKKVQKSPKKVQKSPKKVQKSPKKSKKVQKRQKKF